MNLSDEQKKTLTDAPKYWKLKGVTTSQPNIVSTDKCHHLNIDVSIGTAIISCVFRERNKSDLPELKAFMPISLKCLSAQPFGGAQSGVSILVKLDKSV